MPRTAWTVLTQDCAATSATNNVDGAACQSPWNEGNIPHHNPKGCGCSQLRVEECRNWQVGDRIAVAYNFHRFPNIGFGNAES